MSEIACFLVKAQKVTPLGRSLKPLREDPGASRGKDHLNDKECGQTGVKRMAGTLG